MARTAEDNYLALPPSKLTESTLPPLPPFPPFPALPPAENGSTVAPPPHSASKAESAYSDLDLLPAILSGTDDTSAQFYIRISANALVDLSAFVHNPDGAPIRKVRDICQRFALAQMEDLISADRVQSLQNQLAEEGRAHRRTRRGFEAETAPRLKAEGDLASEIYRREGLRRQDEELRDLSYEETAHAVQNGTLLAEMRAVVAHLVAPYAVPTTAALVLPATATHPAPAVAVPAPQPASTVPAPEPASTVSASLTAPKSHLLKIAEPEPFTGKRSNLRCFCDQLGLVLADQSRFMDEKHRLRYCFQLLRGEAYSTIRQYLGPLGQVKFDNAGALIDELNRIFGDSNEEATAALELGNLRQGNNDFARYYADFSRLAAILEYGDKARRHALDRGLSPELLDRISGQVTPPGESLDGYVDRLKNLDDSLRRAKALKASQGIGTVGNVGRWPNRPARPTATTNMNPPAGTAGTPTVVTTSASLGMGRWITPEERERRAREGRCFFCAEHGHMAAACPHAPPPRSRTSRLNTLRAAATSAPADPTETASPVSLSGNGAA